MIIKLNNVKREIIFTIMINNDGDDNDNEELRRC